MMSNALLWMGGAQVPAWRGTWRFWPAQWLAWVLKPGARAFLGAPPEDSTEGTCSPNYNYRLVVSLACVPALLTQVLILVQHEQIVIILIMLAGQPQARREEHPLPGCFSFLELLLAWAHKQVVGTSWDREACVGVPILRAARPLGLQGRRWQRLLLRLGKGTYFLMDSLGTIQNWLLSDRGSGELLFGVLIHLSSNLPPPSEAMNKLLST